MRSSSGLPAKYTPEGDRQEETSRPRDVKFQSPRVARETLLEQGEVSDQRLLHGGSNVVEIIQIKDNGRGVFKPKNSESAVTEQGTGYRRERAAYLVDLFLDFGLVPPTVIREVNEGNIGSVQEFIADSVTALELPRQDLDKEEVRKQSMVMRLFDFIILNTDRHYRNWLIDQDNKVWAIDHGFSFRDWKDMDEDGRNYVMDDFAALTEHVFDKIVIDKIRELRNSPDKLEILKTLLLELLSPKEVTDCFDRIRLVAEALEDGQISKEDVEIFYDALMMPL